MSDVDTSDTQTMAMLEKRRIEAAILKHVYDTLKASHGVEVAKRTIAEAVRKSAMEQAAELAKAVGGNTSLETFIARQEPWLRGGALERDVLEESDTRYRFNVTRCKYAEMYRDMGLGEIGHLLSCQRDGTFCEGYDDRIKLKRTQTIMQGASHCDFDYTFEKGARK
jgi:L-2-amino-thiazoline-4-carboxylic acid hydrolase